MQYGTQCGIGLSHCEICDLVQLTAQCLKCNIVSFWSALESSFSLLWKLSLISKNVSDMCRITINAELFYGRQNYAQPKAFEYLGDRMYIEMSIQYSLNNLAYLAKNNNTLLQAVSVIGAHHVIRVAILRALRYSLGYSHKTWILRISRSSADTISVIRVGHYTVGVIPNIHSCANSVMNLAWALLRFPRACRRSCDDPPWPEGDLPQWQAITITYPTHRGLLNFQQIRLCLVFANTTVVTGGNRAKLPSSRWRLRGRSLQEVFACSLRFATTDLSQICYRVTRGHGTPCTKTTDSYPFSFLYNNLRKIRRETTVGEKPGRR